VLIIPRVLFAIVVVWLRRLENFLKTNLLNKET
jgi:hypothetical protein